MGESELTAQEKHDQGLELTDADIRELEHPGEPAAAPAPEAEPDPPADDKGGKSL